MAKDPSGKKVFSPDVSDIRTVAIAKHGNVAQMAKHFNVARDTMYQYLNRNEEGMKIIEEVRGYNTFSDLDMAEFVIRASMSQFETRPLIALRAAEKVLDKKGWMRGWLSDKGIETDENKEILTQKFEEILAQLNSESDSNLKMDESSINTETKS